MTMMPVVERKRVPDCCASYRQKMRVGGQVMFLHTGDYPDGTLGEIFLSISKGGTLIRSAFDCFAIAVSLGLQHGVPLDEFVDAFVGYRFEPNGPVQGHEGIKGAASIVDAVFRDLAIRYLGRTDLANVRPETNGDAVTAAVVAAVEAVAEPENVAGEFAKGGGV